MALPSAALALSEEDKASRIQQVLEFTSRNEQEATEALEKHNFDVEAAINAIMNAPPADDMTASETLMSLRQAAHTAQSDSPLDLNLADPDMMLPDDDLQKAIAASMVNMPTTQPTIRTLDTPAGLKNLGNTCYFNTFLQALYGLPSFRVAVMAFQPHEEGMSCSAVLFLKQLQMLFARMKWSTSAVLDPADIIDPLFATPERPFPPTGQQDLLEFCEFFLERIKEGLLHAQPLDPALAAELNDWEPDDQLPVNADNSISATTGRRKRTASTTTQFNPGEDKGPLYDELQVILDGLPTQQGETDAKRAKDVDVGLAETGADSNGRAAEHTRAGAGAGPDVAGNKHISQLDGPGSPPVVHLDPLNDHSSVPIKTYGRNKAHPRVPPANGATTSTPIPVALEPKRNDARPMDTQDENVHPTQQGSKTAASSNIAKKQPRIAINTSNNDKDRPPLLLQTGPSTTPHPHTAGKRMRSQEDRACLICRGIRRDRERFRQQRVAQVEPPTPLSGVPRDQHHAKLQQQDACVLTNNTEVDRMFRGQMVTELQATEADGSAIALSNEEIYETLQVTVEEGLDLNEALAKLLTTNEVEYKTVQGHQTQAQQRGWLKTIPRSLIIREQRVQYDTVTKAAKKVNTRLPFPEHLGMGRFLLDNKAKALELEAQLREHDAQLAGLKQELDGFQKDDVTYDRALRMAADFCTMPSFEAMRDDMDMDVFQAALQVCAGKVEAKRNQLSAEIAQCKEARLKLWDAVNMPASMYRLHAVFIHQGGAGAGHYQAYIRNAELNKWHCYNDSVVREVELQEVLDVGVGGSTPMDNNKNAYMLMYHHAQQDNIVIDDSVFASLKDSVETEAIVATLESG
eukprot:TRINITY_DN7958_c0_g1_i6.p1 TRINITY_DN7958_c0_g1~~TRINITY_DN7958_c0_g1_i6.p1  ORF type:complete len:858 (+),score=246.12 TRINITY_DN7958_c0_g1_i6:116-2689(+)